MQRDVTEWQSRRRDGVLRQPEASKLHTYLLDADGDLADLFDVRTRIAVRQGTTVRMLEAPVGDCELWPALSRLRHGIGLLILDGLMALQTRVGERTATELLGPGDLLQYPGERIDVMLDRTVTWRVLWPTRFGLLDAEFAERVRPWPQITYALLRRANRRTADVDAMRAITCHPRLEVRLDLVFWHLAARWGRVEPQGVRLTLPLTHRLLGQLVAAERPSISHALGRLTHAGLLAGAAGDWHLIGSPEEHMESLIERTVRLTPHGSEQRSPGG